MDNLKILTGTPTFAPDLGLTQIHDVSMQFALYKTHVELQDPSEVLYNFNRCKENNQTYFLEFNDAIGYLRRLPIAYIQIQKVGGKHIAQVGVSLINT